MAHKDMEPELECFDAQTRKSEGFGELKGGFMVRCSLRMCRQYVLCYAIIYIYSLSYSYQQSDFLTQNISFSRSLGRASPWR